LGQRQDEHPLELASNGKASSSYTAATGPILNHHHRLAEMLRLEPPLPEHAQEARELIEDLLYAVPMPVGGKVPTGAEKPCDASGVL
jgi:hypothetical protein